ncbi:DNA polymerase III subunit delta [Ruminococcus turbiniformis]
MYGVFHAGYGSSHNPYGWRESLFAVGIPAGEPSVSLLSKRGDFLYNTRVMKSLNEDLKTGQFKQIYLLCGEEGYLKKQYKERFVKAMLPEGDTMNYAYYEGKNTDIKEVIDLAETLPFFAERRLIVFENTGFFKSSGSELADYIGEMPPTTYFIFIENEVDKRSRLYKAVKSKGHIVELGIQDEATLRKWVAGLVRKENKEMSQADIAYFLNKVGTDMENITGELEKLFCYAMDRDTLTRADVDAVCVTQITNHIFEMVNAVAEQNQKKALDLYYDLLALKEPPMRILFLMTREYRLLFHVKALAEQGYGRKEIASKAGIHPFAAGRYLDQAKRFRLGELRSIMEEGAQIEQRVKTGLLTDSLAVELFIVRQSGKKA